MHKSDAPLKAAGSFHTAGTCTKAHPYGKGHINDTYKITAELPGSKKEYYLLQRINTAVFKNPDQLMNNIALVTEHIKSQLGEGETCLSIVPAEDGKLCCYQPDGSCWRMYTFVSDATTCSGSVKTMEAAGRAYGRFMKQLEDLDPSLLYEVIPDFHNTPKRYADFERAANDDVCGRADSVREEIEFIRARHADTFLLTDMQSQGKLPVRITHNDFKLDNILFDKKTAKPCCIVDLDTVMPGLSLYDFGDSIRSGACTCAEDEQNLSQVKFSMDYFQAFTAGYLSEAAEVLTPDEITYLPQGARIITLEQAIRFLEDYLRGDVYYKTNSPMQNLHRFRVQKELISQMERSMEELTDIVNNLRKNIRK